MATFHGFTCDCCGEDIHTQELPIVVYIVAGVVTGEAIDVTALKDELPPFVQELLAQPLPRQEFCLKCFEDRFTWTPVKTDLHAVKVSGN